MTRRQKQILSFIIKYKKNNGFTPSYQEMCDELGIKSKSQIHSIINNLEEQGYIQKIKGKKRNINVVPLNEKKEIQELKERVQGLECELLEVINVLLKVSPEHEEWINMNFPNYKRGEL